MAINDFFQVGYNPRFFYFKSLLNHSNPEAQQLANSATGQINAFGDDKFNDQDFLNTTKASIELLYNMYIFEKNNEIRLIREKIQPLANRYKNGKYNKLADCISGDKIDYISFMTLLQKLTDDTDAYQHQLEDLLKVMKDYNETADNVLKQKKITNFTDFQRHRNEITADVRLPENAKDKKLTSDLANCHARIGQNSFAIQNNSSNKELYDFLEKNVLSMILNGETEREVQENKEKQIGFYTELLNKIEDLAKDAASSQDKKNKTLKQMTMEYMQEMIASKDPKNKDLEFLKEYCNRMLQYGEVIESEGLQLSSKLNRDGSILTLGKNEKITNLTSSNRKALESLIEDKSIVENVTATITDENGNIVNRTFDIMNKTDRQRYTDMLVDTLLPEKKNASMQEIVDELNRMIKRTQKRKEIITVSTEHKSALNIAAITDAVHAAVDGYLNGKNDATIQTIGIGFLKTNDNEIIEMNETLQNKIKDIMEKDKNLFGEFYKIYIKRENPDKKVNTNTFDIIAQTKAQAAAERLEILHLKEEFAKQQLQINDVRALIQIDDSAKFAETFIRQEGGFHGGSLGSDLLSQINNINNMLLMGGITPLDAERLMSMVLNAGDALIGSNMRPALENYFTTVGSMLMFRSGGNAIQEWKRQAENQYNNSPTKIHIYQLGPAIVPESYVLLKTFEALNNCVNLLETEASDEGTKVKIYNPVSDKDIVKNTNGIPDWNLTAIANYKKVKLEMVLMGGFLDLMEQMLDKMQSIG